ncbi:MAG TPA: archease [bacterium]|nr:archease [bacterium]HDP99633.1 archease [bacterium]
MSSAASPKRYEQLEHSGDIRIKVFGESLKNLYVNAGYALFDIITDAEKIKSELAETVEASGNDREELIVNWLSELNYLYLTERKIFNKFEIDRLTETELSATAIGEKFNPRHHKLKKEIKAVTFHDLEIQQRAKHWETKIVFDI